MSTTQREPGSRIRFFNHEGKRILLVDLSNCSAREAEETTRRVPDLVTAEPPSSVLILTDFKGSTFDAAALRAIKETAVFDKPFVKKSALIGTLSLPREFSSEFDGMVEHIAGGLFVTRETAGSMAETIRDRAIRLYRYGAAVAARDDEHGGDARGGQQGRERDQDRTGAGHRVSG